MTFIPDPAISREPAPAPDPGAFTASSFFTSPSTYLTLVTYLLPILNMVFGQDVSETAQAFANASPIIATGILLVARNRQQIARVHANTTLAQIAATPAAAPVPIVASPVFMGEGAGGRIGALESQVQELKTRNDVILNALQEMFAKQPE